MIFSPQKQKFVDSATEMFGIGTVINKQQVRDHLQMLVCHLLVGL